MTMERLRQLLARDVRNQRWLLLAWILALIANVAGRVIGPQLPIDGTGDEFAGTAIGSLMFIHMVLAFVAIALIVHTDVVIGTSAFWLTRPIPRGMMFGAKLLAISFLLLLPAIAIEGLLMAAYGVSPAIMVLALLQQAWMMLPILLMITFGASVTRSLPQLLLLAVASLAGVLLWGAVDWNIWPHPTATALPLSPRSYDPSAWIIGGTLLIGCLLVALGFQYLRRQALLAVLIGSLCVVANGETRDIWTHVSLFGGEPRPPQEAWTTAPLVLRSGGQPTWPALRQAARIVADAIDRSKMIAAPLTIEGLPSNYSAHAFTTEATLRFAQATVRSTPQAAYERSASEDGWPVILNASNNELRAAGHGLAALHAQFDIGLIRHDRLATVPLTPGAGYNDGARSVFVRSVRSLTGPTPRCLARLDVTEMNLVTQRRRSPRIEVHARLGSGTPLQTMISNESTTSGFGRSFDSFPPYMHPFEITWRDVEIFAPQCEGLRIDIERVSYAGRLLRTLDLPEVNVNDVIAVESP